MPMKAIDLILLIVPIIMLIISAIILLQIATQLINMMPVHTLYLNITKPSSVGLITP